MIFYFSLLMVLVDGPFSCFFLGGILEFDFPEIHLLIDDY